MLHPKITCDYNLSTGHPGLISQLLSLEDKNLSISPITLMSVFGNNIRNTGTRGEDLSLGLIFSAAVLITDGAGTPNH